MVVINIIIRSSEKETKIQVDTNYRIRDLKAKIINIFGFDKQTDLRLYFQSKLLYDNQLINDCEIGNNSLIHVVKRLPLIGGEVGSAVKGFTDPTKVGPVRYNTTTEGPDYLIVKKGINLFGNCENKNCIAYKKEVSSPFGFGTFDLIKDLDPDNEKCPKCPSCEFPLFKLETCGFMLCRYKYTGKKIENEKLVPVVYEKTISEPKKLDYFDAGKKGENKSLWVDLKITAYSL